MRMVLSSLALIMEYYERNSEQLKKEARDRYKLKRVEKIKEEKRKKLYGE